jgi:hypothetical protein
MMRRILAVAGGFVVVLVLILGVAQLVLPGVAARHLRAGLSRHGRVLAVRVYAFPAIKLLWHRADRVMIRMASYTSSSASLAGELGEVADTSSLDASVGVLHAGLLTVHDATLLKRGVGLTARGTVREADLRAALPILDSVILVRSAGGQLTVRGTGTLFGVSATVDAIVRPSAGALVVSPDVPFGTLASITLFSNPGIAVRSILATPAADGFTATIRARLR